MTRKMQKWHLSELIKSFVPENISQSCSSIEINSIACDSRLVEQGSLFFAISGVKIDGTKFIPQAIKNGASAIVVENNSVIDESVSKNIKLIQVDNIRYVLSKIAALFYPIQADSIVAITGTNGKTSTAHFCKEIWQNLGKDSASIGTLGIYDTKNIFTDHNKSSLTTPDAISLHKNIQILTESGINNIAMEASSHGLDQYRIHGIKVKAAAFTNISRDHLDYHKTEECYLQAKLKLFTEILANDGTAIINAEIPQFEQIKQSCQQHKIISYGYSESSNIRIISVDNHKLGQKVKLNYFGKELDFKANLIGKFQIENIIAAIALLTSCGENIEEIINTLPLLTSVRGRMQIVDPNSSKSVIVDYAHTPDALEKALIELSPYAKESKLWLVFGCGGDRDKGKRSKMGKIADNLADEVIITDDNPRTENPNAIRKEIISSCPNAKEIGDRAKAIKYAVNKMQDGDILLIAGKGHETYQIIGTEYHQFNDVAVVEELLV